MRTAIALPVVRGQGLAGGGKMQVAHAYTLVFLGLMVLGCGAVAPVAAAGEKLRVGISPFAPFVMFTEKGPEGAAIDAWQLIARHLGVKWFFVKCQNIATSWSNC